jgi:hypothetical protein
MSDKERKEYMQKFGELRKKLATDPVAAKEFLVAAGIITAKGNLRKPYRNLCIPQDRG